MSLRDQLQTIYDQRGELTPALVVETARPKNHPLHNRFEWNNSLAGESWRRHQAAELIRSCEIVYREATDTDPEHRIRAFHAVKAESGHVYEPVEQIADDPFTRELVLRDALRRWQDLKRRYQDLAEFFDLVKADLETEIA